MNRMNIKSNVVFAKYLGIRSLKNEDPRLKKKEYGKIGVLRITMS